MGRGAHIRQKRQGGPSWGNLKGLSRRIRRGGNNVEMDSKKQKALAWTGLICARIRTSRVSCKQDNEQLFSIKSEKFLTGQRTIKFTVELCSVGLVSYFVSY